MNVSILAQDYKSHLQSGSVELIEYRTINSKTFQNLDGTLTAVIFLVPVHKFINYKWEDIDFKNGDEDGVTDPILTPGATIKRSYDINNNESYAKRLGEIGLGLYSHIGNNFINERGYLRWNMFGALPPNPTILKSVFDIGITNNSNGSTYNAYDLTSDPEINPPPSAQSVYNDCGSGYLYRANVPYNNGYFEFNGSEQKFNVDLKTRLSLSNPWMAIGFKNNDEGDVNHYLIYPINYNRGALVVTYNLSTPAQLSVAPLSYNPSPYGETNPFGPEVQVTNSGSSEVLDYTICSTTNFGNWISYTIYCAPDYCATPTCHTTLPPQYPSYFFISVFKKNYTGYVRSEQVTIKGYLNGSEVSGSPKIITVTQAPAPTITLPGQACSNCEVYKATNWIEANTFIIGSSDGEEDINNAIFVAGNYIDLKPGFWAKENSTFSAYTQSFLEDKDNVNLAVNDFLNIENQNNNINSSINNLEVKHPLDQNIGIIPNEYFVNQNYPNPFNPLTVIKYGLKQSNVVSLKIYDILGRELKTLVDEYQSAGYKSVTWDGTNNLGATVSSGLYFYKMIVGDFVDVKKMVLMK